MIGDRTTALITIVVAGLMAATASARADGDGWRHDGWRDQGRHDEWRHDGGGDEWRHHDYGEWGYDRPRFPPPWNAPFAYAPPPPYYYARPSPPVYYAPRRYYRYGD